MKRPHNWKLEAAWYQRLAAAMVYKLGGNVTLSQEDLKEAVEKGIQVAQIDGNVCLRVPEQHRSRIMATASLPLHGGITWKPPV